MSDAIDSTAPAFTHGDLYKLVSERAGAMAAKFSREALATQLLYAIANRALIYVEAGKVRETIDAAYANLTEQLKKEEDHQRDMRRFKRSKKVVDWIRQNDEARQRGEEPAPMPKWMNPRKKRRRRRKVSR